MAVVTYSPADVIVTVGGVRLTHFDDGDFISVSYADDAFTKIKGVGGEITRNYNPSTDGEIKITLKSSSASNDYLSGLHITDRATLLGTVPVFIKDTNGRDLVTAAEAWIKKMPDITKGKEVTTREWVFDCAEIVMFAGGND